MDAKPITEHKAAADHTKTQTPKVKNSCGSSMCVKTTIRHLLPTVNNNRVNNKKQSSQSSFFSTIQDVLKDHISPSITSYTEIQFHVDTNLIVEEKTNQL